MTGGKRRLERRRLLHAHPGEKRQRVAVPRSSSRKRKEEETLSELRERILDMLTLSDAELFALRSGDHFTMDPKLALAYFHCCGCNPEAFVYNDERVMEGGAVDRLKSVVDRSVSAEEVARCQEAVKNRVARNKSIWACCSCCEIIFGEDNAIHTSVRDLPDTFQVSVEEMRDRYGGVSAEVRQAHLQVTEEGDVWYYLNPDLVQSSDRVVLCKACAANPRKNKFSIASGHDYGRRGKLEELNDVATNCISPVRLFGIEISLSSRFCHGHSIFFPSDGPAKCSHELPQVDEDCQPHVTFVGPREQWRVTANSFRHLYDIPVDDVYEWLEVLSQIHSYWRDEGIVIERSDERRRELQEFVAAVESRVAAVASNTVADLADTELREMYADTDISTGGDVITRKSVVLQEGVDLLNGPNSCPSSNAVVDSFLDTIQTVMASNGDGNDVTKDTCSAVPPVIPIERSGTPIVEWTANGEILAGAFPTLFMTGGAMLPKGSLPKDFIHHLLFYYDGRFEQSATLIGTMFNQLQRHSAVQKTARTGASHGKVLLKLTGLANDPCFRDQLEIARAHPDSKLAKCLNAKLLRILSLVGDRVPFSPFELASAKPKIDAMRLRYDLATHWVTVAPPEHDDLALHRVTLLRSSRGWNDEGSVVTQARFSWGDLPEALRTSARMRLAVSNRYPALAVRAFDEAFDVVTADLFRCCASKDVKKSHDYGERERGVLSTVAGFAAVVEPQKCGRLHTHMTVYGSTWTPQLLARSVCNSDLQTLAKEWMDSVSRTYLTDDIWAWFSEVRGNEESEVSNIPRPSSVVVPDAASNYCDFNTIAQKCLLGTNLHRHSATCIKGRRGRHMCRLNRPAGVFDGETAPVELSILQNGALWKGERGIVEERDVSADTKQIIDGGYNIEKDHTLLRRQLDHPVVWEQHRCSRDGMVVETSLALSLLSQSHTNASIISCEDAGDSVQAYQRNYMTKESGGLQNTASVFVSAVDEVRKYPSSADDRDSPLRQAKYLASRIVNSFAGAREWPLSVMVYALQGRHSFISSDVYWYIFPWRLVRYLETDSDSIDEGAVPPLSDGTETCEHDRLERMSPQIESMLDEIISDVDEELRNVRQTMEDVDRDNNFAGSDSVSADTGGTRAFKLNGKTVFVSQAQSYVHRGVHFADYSPAEFESIVDVRPTTRETKARRGRKRRTGFSFAATHPLYPHYEGCIRTKFKTLMLGGAPPPTYKVALRKKNTMDQLAKYLISAFVPWTIDTGKPQFELNIDGLQEVCRQWDRSNASLVERQRYRWISNILRRGNQNHAAGDTYMHWRARNVDWWADERQQYDGHDVETYRCTTDGDPEQLGSLPDTEMLFQLARMSALHSKDTSFAVGEVRSRFWSIIPSNYARKDLKNSKLNNCGGLKQAISTNIFRCEELENKQNTSLGDIADAIQRMVADVANKEFNEEDGGRKRNEAFSCKDDTLLKLTKDQRNIVNYLVQNVGYHEPTHRNQTLSMLHGAAGTGKSVVIRAVVKELEARDVDVVVTCPTGIGASHLPHGRTFHSAFKVGRKRCKPIPPNKLELLRLHFHEHVGMVIIDEVSMLDTEMLVLMDQRLRALYDSTKVFGGISILLVGDFLQLDAVRGISLCKVLYTNDDKDDCVQARELFQRFRVFHLQNQMRAEGCVQHQEVLDDCHSLPCTFPKGTRWGRDQKDYHPISRKVLGAVTKPLTQQDLRDDPAWLGDSMRILVTTNLDKAALTPCAALMLANHEDQLLFKWPRQLHTDVPAGIKTMLYDESVHPYMYGYFVKGAPAQILDNSNGNLAWGVANGTSCRFHSMAWEDKDIAAEIERKVRHALRSNERIVELSVPPDYINVVLVDSNFEPITGEHWPEELNLDTNWVTDEHGRRMYKQNVVIPIGLVKANAKNYKIRVGASADQKDIAVYYQQHAVEMSLVMTVWKAQGATMDRVLLLLESATNRCSWGFEHLYVALSRVRSSNKLRCFPLSAGFKRSTLRQLKPSIYTVKWLMSINDGGYWCSMDE